MARTGTGSGVQPVAGPPRVAEARSRPSQAATARGAQAPRAAAEHASRSSVTTSHQHSYSSRHVAQLHAKHVEPPHGAVPPPLMRLTQSGVDYDDERVLPIN